MKLWECKNKKTTHNNVYNSLLVRAYLRKFRWNFLSVICLLTLVLKDATKSYTIPLALILTRPEICIQNTSSICIKMMDM